MDFAHTDSISELLCINCQSILSHFPIYFHPYGSTCGRCPEGENAVRNEVYEALAKYKKFPCRYSQDGCLENLFPRDIPQHERLCSFRKYACIIINSINCEWQGFAHEMLIHFEEEHCTFIMNEGNFEIDFINSHKENYLFPYGENLFVVNRSTDSKAGTFSCTVTYLGNSQPVEEYSYKIILESGNGSKMHEITKKLKCTTEIDSQIIRSILNDPTSVVAKIEVFQEEEFDIKDDINRNSDIDYDLLRELECLVCMEYMVPPIHQCLTGHSICLKCKDTVKECPTCKQEFKNTQNFALAQIINHIKYPCKNDKCSFTAKAKDIKSHEATCKFGLIKCPLSEYVDCSSLMIFTEMYDHISNNHYEHLLEMETVVDPFDHEDKDSVEDCYIKQYGKKLFKLHYLYNEDNFFWAMQLIGPAEESHRYKFEIDILDTSGNGERAYFKRSCGPMTVKSEAFLKDMPHIFCSYEQLKHLIGSELSCRIRIVSS